MPHLDCTDLDSTLSSLSAALETAPTTLQTALENYDEAPFADHAEDPWEQMPRELTEHFGASVDEVRARFDGAFYFHGTRVVDPDAFYRRGILPLDHMIDPLWSTLRELAPRDLTNEDWALFVNSVESGVDNQDTRLYRLKTGSGLSFGPFGLLVREILLDPGAASSHDYLRTPEIIEDIARAYLTAYGVDLQALFCAASHPCVVTFKRRQLRPGAVKAALWYSYTKVRDGELTMSANWSFDGSGYPVPPEDIVSVKIISP